MLGDGVDGFAGVVREPLDVDAVAGVGDEVVAVDDDAFAVVGVAVDDVAVEVVNLPGGEGRLPSAI